LLVAGLLIGVVTTEPSAEASFAVGRVKPTLGTTSSRLQSCRLSVSITALTTAQLARMTIVDPVDEGAVRTLAPEVTSGIGGIILVGTDATPALGSELSKLMKLAPKGRAPFVMVDEEGGSVQRLVSVVGNIPSARTMGETMTTSQIRALASRLGGRMRRLGITMDLAPVVDLDAGAGPNTTDADGTRSFSVNPAVTAPDALAFAQGLLGSRVLPVLKHFPGLGGATGNTDLERASTLPYAGVNAAPLVPFRVAIRAGMPAVMISNAQVPRLTNLPAGLSSTVVTTLLRHQLGFSGLVLTDSLSANSIPQSGFPLTTASVAAIAAGADEVLFNATDAQVASDNAAITTAMVQAVSTAQLSRARLVSAVRDAQRAKAEVGAC
jgi:beta-N-acetylhexosaminidase